MQANEEQAKVHGKPENFADHHTQATLFYESQTLVEKAHIAAAFRFELSKVTVPAIRERTVSMLRNASQELAQKVVDGLGMETMPDAMPLALANPAKPEVIVSPPLPLMARPGHGTIKARKVALLIAPGAIGASIALVQAALMAQGAIPRLVAPRIGAVKTAEGETLQADASLENEPGFLFDALVLPDSQTGVEALARDGHTMEFIKEQYRHCKTILVFGASSRLLEKAGVPTTLADGTPNAGLILVPPGGSMADVAATFIKGMAMHRLVLREIDPPMV